MANLQVKGMDDRLYSSLKSKAKQENRSVSQEVIQIITRYLNDPTAGKVHQTDSFLDLCGSLEDREAEQMLSDIQSSRKESPRFGDKNELFA